MSIKIKKEVKEVEILADIICDICGKSCKDKIGINYEYSTLSANWGYGSGKDDIRWNFQFCESCSNKLEEYIDKLKNG